MMEIKVHALHAGVTSVKDTGKEIDMVLSESSTNEINGEVLFKETMPLGRALKVGVQENKMKVVLTKQNNWLDNLKFLAKCLEESMAIVDEKV